VFAAEISEFSPNQISAKKMVHFEISKIFAKSGEEKNFNLLAENLIRGKLRMFAKTHFAVKKQNKKISPDLANF